MFILIQPSRSVGPTDFIFSDGVRVKPIRLHRTGRHRQVQELIVICKHGFYSEVRVDIDNIRSKIRRQADGD